MGERAVRWTLWTDGRLCVWLPEGTPPEVVAEALRVLDERLAKADRGTVSR